jgi:hypothetical protein
VDFTSLSFAALAAALPELPMPVHEVTRRVDARAPQFTDDVATAQNHDRVQVRPNLVIGLLPDIGGGDDRGTSPDPRGEIPVNVHIVHLVHIK